MAYLCIADACPVQETQEVKKREPSRRQERKVGSGEQTRNHRPRNESPV